MLFNLDIIGIDRNPLDVSNALIHSESINIYDDGETPAVGGVITLPVPLQAGNTYDIVFPAGGATVYSGVSSLSGAGIIATPISNAILTSGGTIQVTPTANTPTLTIDAPTVTPFADTFNITSIQNLGGIVFVTTDVPHGLSIGNNTTLSGNSVETGVHAVTGISDEFIFTIDDVVSTPGDSDTTGTATGFNVQSFYNETVQVRGEDITITIDWGAGSQVFTGTNQVDSLVIPDNSTVEVTVESSGYYTYNNTMRVYGDTVPVNASVLLQPIITNPLDPNWRRPYPNFFVIQEPCSYRTHIYDGQNAPFGMISYENEGEEFSAGVRNTVLDTCVPDILALDQRIVVREVPNCGGTSPILWDLRYSDATEANTYINVTTTEFKPTFQIDNEFNCTVPIDQEIFIQPELIDLAIGGIHGVCDIDNDVDPALVYTLTTPSNQIEVLGEFDGATVNTAVTSQNYLPLEISFTPSELGTYELCVSLMNCCTNADLQERVNRIAEIPVGETYDLSWSSIAEVEAGLSVDTNTAEIIFDQAEAIRAEVIAENTTCYQISVSNIWQLTNTDCNQIVLANLSSQFSVTYTLKELTENNIFEIMTVDGVLQEDLNVSPSEEITLDLIEDNLYTIDISTNSPNDEPVEKIFLLDCNIKRCKKKFLLDISCPTTEDCPERTRQELYKNYNYFKALEEIVYHRWDEWVRQQSVFSSFNINDELEEALSVKDIMKELAKVCKACGILKVEDCGCNN